jgi:hypothetical protein
MSVFSSAVRKFGLVSVIFASFSGSAWATPTQVLIIRHAEKVANSDDLSPVGYIRANALVQYFEKDSEVTRYGTPVAIYAMGSGDQDSSKRPVETVTPLAKALGLTLHTKYQKDDIQALVSEIMSDPQYDGKMVLICWEHKVIADIAVQFGVDPGPSKWPKEDFSTVYELDFSGDKLAKFTSFSERVDVPKDPNTDGNDDDDSGNGGK